MTCINPPGPLSTTALTSPSSTPLNGCVVFHSGCFAASTLIRSRAKASWKYIGCSAHRVPSLSKTAMRSAGATKSAPPCVVVRPTKTMRAFLASPSFHDGSGSASASGDDDTGPLRGISPAGALQEARTQQRPSRLTARSLISDLKRRLEVMPPVDLQRHAHVWALEIHPY